MARKSEIERDLEALRQALPDPFDLPAKLDVFFDGPIARKLLAGGAGTIRRIMSFLAANPQPALARVAVLVLSRFEPTAFYPELLLRVGKADKAMIGAFEPGLWLLQLPPQQIAQDLVSLVASSGNPYALLLLQRPVAKAVRSQLAGFIQQRQLPLSLYALYSYGYTLESKDISLMKEVSTWVDIPEMSALAGLYLLKLGSKDGRAGIRAGLLAPDEQLRTMTY
jgi:hypothetical protein